MTKDAGFNSCRPAGRTVLLQIDLSKAFDVINHDKLIADLLDTMLPTAIVRWFGAYLCGCQSRVLFCNWMSTARNVRVGVPQGVVTSATLQFLPGKATNILWSSCNMPMTFLSTAMIHLRNKSISSGSTRIPHWTWCHSIAGEIFSDTVHVSQCRSDYSCWGTTRWCGRSARTQLQNSESCARHKLYVFTTLQEYKRQDTEAGQRSQGIGWHHLRTTERNTGYDYTMSQN